MKTLTFNQKLSFIINIIHLKGQSNMNYFNPTPANLQELRTMYKTLVFRYHPDVHPELSGDEMKAINTQYEDLSRILAHETKFEESELHFSDLYKDIIEALKHGKFWSLTMHLKSKHGFINLILIIRKVKKSFLLLILRTITVLRQ